MKKNLLIIIVLGLITSCISPRELKNISEKRNFYAIDFREYSKNGFLITPEKYIGDYQSIGIVRFEVYPGASYTVVERKVNPNYNPNTTGPNSSKYYDVKEWIVRKISMQDALDGIFEKCKEMGADALVNFKMDYDAVPYDGISNPVVINGYIITGYAIKRK